MGDFIYAYSVSKEKHSLLCEQPINVPCDNGFLTIKNYTSYKTKGKI